MSIPVASKKAGIKAETIYSWLNEEADKNLILDNDRKSLTPEEMTSRIVELEKELKQVNTDRQILAEALDFFTMTL